MSQLGKDAENQGFPAPGSQRTLCDLLKNLYRNRLMSIVREHPFHNQRFRVPRVRSAPPLEKTVISRFFLPNPPSRFGVRCLVQHVVASPSPASWMATLRLKSPASSASTSALSDDGSQTTASTATRDWTPRHTQARPPSSPRSRGGSPSVGSARAPTEFGLPTELWTASRVAQVIERTYGITFHPRYLDAWLADRDITPHKPKRQSLGEKPRSRLARTTPLYPHDIMIGGVGVPRNRRTGAPRGSMKSRSVVPGRSAGGHLSPSLAHRCTTISDLALGD